MLPALYLFQMYIVHNLILSISNKLAFSVLVFSVFAASNLQLSECFFLLLYLLLYLKLTFMYILYYKKIFYVKSSSLHVLI